MRDTCAGQKLADPLHPEKRYKHRWKVIASNHVTDRIPQQHNLTFECELCGAVRGHTYHLLK